MAGRADLVEGIGALMRGVAELERTVEGPALRRAVMSGGQRIADNASRRAPRSSGPPTRGTVHLADSIHPEVTDAGAHHVQVGVGFGKDQWHGIPIELGGKNRAPHPMLRPAFTSEKENVIRDIKRVLGGEIKAVADMTYRVSRKSVKRSRARGFAAFPLKDGR